MSDKAHTFSFIFSKWQNENKWNKPVYTHLYYHKAFPAVLMFPRMRLLFPQRHISLLYLKEKIVLSNKKAPAGDDGHLCMSYCGKHFISTRKWDNKEQYTGGFTLSFHTDTALPPQWNSFKKRIPCFFIHGKTNPIHPSSGRESPGTPSIEKTLSIFPRHFHNCNT